MEQITVSSFVRIKDGVGVYKVVELHEDNKAELKGVWPHRHMTIQPVDNLNSLTNDEIKNLKFIMGKEVHSLIKPAMQYKK